MILLAAMSAILQLAQKTLSIASEYIDIVVYMTSKTANPRGGDPVRILYAHGTERQVMNTDNVESQQDWAFDRLDDLMDTAVWKRGSIILKPGKSTIYCYDVPMLRRELLELAANYVRIKFKQCDCSFDGVVSNILEEYELELTKYGILRTRSRQHQHNS
jgi:hypothetical protein